jgi:hypothetical protein
MISDCFFCGADLPELVPNDLAFDERIAFDPKLGRLWQVCGECRRWNLTPIESRWEIVEECDRVAQLSPPLLNTEHLSLVPSGAGQLIRVGLPTRLEFAEWRYSSTLDGYSGTVGRVKRAFLSLPELPIGGFDFYGAARSIPEAWLGSPFLEHGAVLGALFLNVPLVEQCPSCGEPLFIHPAAFGDLRFERSSAGAGLAAPCGLCGDSVLIDIREARPGLRAGLALVNHKYRQISQVERAVRPLDHMGGAPGLMKRLCTNRTAIGELPRPARLALWIALDELAEAEALEAEWQAAESLARIADKELTIIPGFDAFRDRVLSETPR